MTRKSTGPAPAFRTSCATPAGTCTPEPMGSTEKVRLLAGVPKATAHAESHGSQQEGRCVRHPPFQLRRAQEWRTPA